MAKKAGLIGGTKPEGTWTVVQYLLALVAVIGLFFGQRPGHGQPWQLPMLLVGAASAAASLVVFAWRVRAEAQQTRRPWQGTALFNDAVLSCALLVGYAATLLLAGWVLDPWLAWLASPARIEATLATCVLMGIEATRIVLINRLLRQGRDLPSGATELYSVATWSQRRLGRWWLPEVAGLASICLGMIVFQWLGSPSPLFWMIWGPGGHLRHLILHERGLYQPQHDERRAALARQRELELSPEYKALKARNGWIEGWSSVAGLAGLILPFLGLWQLHPFTNEVALILWSCGVALGLPLPAATAVALTATLPWGRARWYDLRTYYSLKYRDPGCRLASYLVLRSALFTAVSSTGLTLSLLHRT